MARVLLAWELGGGLGHVLPLRQLAGQLIEAGHEVLFAARDLLRARSVFNAAGPGSMPCAVLAAPAFPGLQLPAGQLCSLADVLWFEAGGHAANALSAQFFAWRGLLEQLRIDLLIADAAPMAIAAAAGVCPSIAYGSFFHSTDAHGWGVFRDWERIDRAAVDHRAQQLLAHLNQTRQQAGLPRVEHLHEAFPAALNLLRTLPELDPFGPRDTVRYVGQLGDRAGSPPSWPETAQERRVLAYLRADHAQIDRILGGLARCSEARILCFCEGLPLARRPRAAHLSFAESTLDLTQLLGQIDAVVCHAGSLQTLAVLHGKPVLSLPTHTEQFLAARQAMQAGIGLMALPLERPDVLSGLRRILNEPAFAARAEAIATAHRARVPDIEAAIRAAVQVGLAA